MKRWGKRLLDLLYPPKCVFCRRLLEDEEIEICNRSRIHLPIRRDFLDAGPDVSRCVAAFYYQDDVRESILRFKFEGMEQYAACYGSLLAPAVSARIPEDAYDAVTWIPISRKRRRGRGYDQAGLLAKAVAGQLGKPLFSTLRKIRDNPPQSTMASASKRRENVKRVYEATDVSLVAGRRLLLVDDILTTNATMSEAARTLREAGAAAVLGAVMASGHISNEE